MNPRLMVSNHASFNALVKNCVARAINERVRAVAVIRSAPENWLEEFARRNNHEYLPERSTTDRSDRIYKLLGSERLSAVIQLGQKPDYGLLAAVAGTVRAGGVFIVGIPSVEPTPESLRNSLKRLTHLAQRTAEIHAELMFFVDYTPHSRLSSSGMSASSVVLQQSSMQHIPQTYINPQAAAEQDVLLEKAYRHIVTHVHSRTVITGRRGRGKSTLMARLAAKLSQNGIDTRVTAMHESALGTYRQLEGDTGRYLSPESATIEPDVNALMVDEAASFPIAQLEAYADRCRHLVLSTTVEGYETAGRALALRLLPAAGPADDSSARRAILQLKPEHPWRWSAGDPLEEFIDRLLLTHISSGMPELENTTHADRERLAKQSVTRLIHRDELLRDDALFANIHALLLSNHYQSGTKDLEHLLDAPTIQLWIQQIDNHVVGAILLEFEGSIGCNLHEAILAKRRRLKNQLLPQLLAQMANSKAGLSRSYARVLRLAVTPALRRQGIASNMLKTVTSSIRSESFQEREDLPVCAIAAIGASFAADDRSLNFWQSQGFVEFHRGFKANPRTGKCAAAVMKTYDRICSAVLNRAVSIYNENEQARLTKIEDLPPQFLCIDEPDNNPKPVSDHDRALLYRFASGQRSQHDTLAALHTLAAHISLPLNHHFGDSRKQYEKALRDCVLLWLESQ